MGFFQLVLLEGVLLLCAGMIFFGGIRGTIIALIALSAINLLIHQVTQFWYWEIPLIVGGFIGILVERFLGHFANKSQIIAGPVGGLMSLVLFGAFVTPVAAIVLLGLILGTGIMPKIEIRQFIWSITPTFLRLTLGIALIIYGNVLTF